MGPLRRSRGVNKRYADINEVSPARHEKAPNRGTPRKRKLSEILGPQWSKEELERFYVAYRKHGKDWKKVGAVLRNRSIDMVDALYSMNRAYLSLPEGTASVAGLIAMMTDHYSNLAGSDCEQENNEGAGTSRKLQKRSQAKVPPRTSKRSEGRLTIDSHAIASSYDHLPLSKKKCSDGSPPRAVRKRTPRIPVSYTHENRKGNTDMSPSRQGLSFDDDNDSGVGHENLIALAEASQRGGSPPFSCSPKRMVGNQVMDEDNSEGRMEADNGDCSRDMRYMFKAGNKSTLSQKGGRPYGKKLEVGNNKKRQDEIREACSGTEGQKLGPVREKIEAEVTNGKTSRYSQVQWKRSTKVLFDRDEGSALTGLEALANAVLMPESTNEIDSSIQIKGENNEGDELEPLEGIHKNRLIEKQRVSETKRNESISGSKHATNKTSKMGKDSFHGAGHSSEAKLKSLESITKPSKIKQKTWAPKVPTVEDHSDAFVSESQLVEGKEVGKKLTSKGKWSSQSASPMLNKHPENSSSSTSPRKEADDSAISGVHFPGADLVGITNKVRSRRKTKMQKAYTYADSELSDKTKQLFNFLSNDRVRRWCAFEWFYSAIDYPWFAKREFVEYLLHVGLGHVPRLTHVEWGVIRSSLGKPRRFSVQFLKEEKEKLNLYRDSVRTHYNELRLGTREGLPTDLARPLSVGQRVIAIHPKTREIHDGSILTVDHNRCRVQFDRPELGVEFVMDIDCMPLYPLENMPISLTRRTSAINLENLNKFRLNGQANDKRPEEYINLSLCDNQENINSGTHTLPTSYPMYNVLKPGKVTSALCCLKQRNTYQGNVSLTWPRSMDNSGGSGVLNSSNCSELQSEETGSVVNEIVESSRTRARTMVNAAVEAFSLMKGGGNTYEKIEEAIDHVYDQIPSDDSYITERSFTAFEGGNLASQEQLTCGTFSQSQGLTGLQSKNQSLVPSELITKCVATLLMIQKCTERQFPPADVAQILDSAVTSLQPCSSKNLPVYADIEKCMIMIRNQIMALVPT